MSRVGNLPIEVPQGVTITVSDDNIVKVKGPLGELEQQIDKLIVVSEENGHVNISRVNETKIAKSLHGLSRSLINNMIVGVKDGYQKTLEIIGVGYRAAKNGKNLDIQLGFSHPIVWQDPEGITTEVPEQTKIIVKGIDKQAVGNYAAKIRDLRRPEPYKGKGIRYEGEYVRRKEGKTAK
ncbi:MAG: 50S ribosomal protein L6 [Bacillota bacterium]|nr:50S ribosomal protein L6 [Bacillota bacterium]